MEAVTKSNAKTKIPKLFCESCGREMVFESDNGESYWDRSFSMANGKPILCFSIRINIKTNEEIHKEIIVQQSEVIGKAHCPNHNKPNYYLLKGNIVVSDWGPPRGD